LLRSSLKNTKTDAELVASYRQTNDQSCIEVLFNRYSHLVFAVAMKYLHNSHESKDSVLEIFEKVPADIRRYDIKNFSHWIYIVTKNHCYQLLKKRKHSLPVETLDYQSPAGGRDEDGDSDIGKYLVEHLEDSLNSLNEEQRTCIRQFYLEEKSYEEIELATGFSYNQVKSYIQNGKRNLKIYLAKFIKRSD
jgi:RNA polymerase sigma factor (sigma-70 family)